MYTLELARFENTSEKEFEVILFDYWDIRPSVEAQEFDQYHEQNLMLQETAQFDCQNGLNYFKKNEVRKNKII